MHKPVKELTELMEHFVRVRMNSIIHPLYPIIFSIITLLPLGIIYAVFYTTPVLQKTANIIGVIFIITIVIVSISNLFLYKKRADIGKKYRLVLQSGEYQSIEVLDRNMELKSRKQTSYYLYTIQLRYNNETIQFKTKDGIYAQLFNPGIINALVHEDAAGVIIPENSWAAYAQTKEQVDKKYTV